MFVPTLFKLICWNVVIKPEIEVATTAKIHDQTEEKNEERNKPNRTMRMKEAAAFVVAIKSN